MELIKKLDVNITLWWYEKEGLFGIVDHLNDAEIKLTCDAIETLNFQSCHIASIIDLWREKIENSIK